LYARNIIFFSPTDALRRAKFGNIIAGRARDKSKTVSRNGSIDTENDSRSIESIKRDEINKISSPNFCSFVVVFASRSLMAAFILAILATILQMRHARAQVITLIDRSIDRKADLHQGVLLILSLNRLWQRLSGDGEN